MDSDFDIDCIMKATAKSLCNSLKYYWPARRRDTTPKEGNDAPERNVTIHAASTLLRDGNAVFAEVDHPWFLTCPNPDDKASKIDLLAISPDRKYFLAAEFKRLIKKSGLGDSSEDIDRLVAFQLDYQLKEERCGKEAIRVLDSCESGIGLVAGLKWAAKHNEPTANKTIADKINRLRGQIRKPIPVYEYDVSVNAGSYYLLYAYFPIPVIQP